MKKVFLLVGLLLGNLYMAHAQEGLPVLVSIIGSGDIYEVNVDNCDSRLICSTGKDFNDIAFTPDGKLWGRTIDSLFRIDTTTGNSIPIGRAPIGNALVGLNDSMLLIDSSEYLFSIKTTDASAQLIGDMGNGYFAEGDFTWVGKYLYMTSYNAIGGLIKIKLDSTYHHIQNVDVVADTSSYTYVTYSLASLKTDSLTYKLYGFATSTDCYSRDPETGSYQLVCTSSIALPVSGATSMLFPPPAPLTSINEPGPKGQIKIYPNPANEIFYIYIKHGLNNYKIAITDIEGKVLLMQNPTGTRAEINISSLAPGMYYIQLKDKNNNLIGISKILKK